MYAYSQERECQVRAPYAAPRPQTSLIIVTLTMQLGLSEALPALVARRFTTARDAGHLVFSKTHLSIINAAGISVSDLMTSQQQL